MSKIFSSKLKTLLIIIGIVVVLLTAVMFFYLTGIGAVGQQKAIKTCPLRSRKAAERQL